MLFKLYQLILASKKCIIAVHNDHNINSKFATKFVINFVAKTHRDLLFDPKNTKDGTSNLSMSWKESLTILCKKIKDVNKADEYYKDLIKSNHNNLKYIRRYAAFLDDVKKDYEKAAEHYKKSIDLGSSSNLMKATFW